MLINGKTLEEIKRGIKCHVCWGDCSTECPYDDVRNKPAHECIQSMTKDALALIEHLEAKVPKWIKVEERLPEEFISVQVYMTDAGDFPSVREGYYVDEGRFYIPALHEFHPVSHWKPFDEPPEEDE